MTSPELELTFHEFQISDGTAWCPMKFMVDSGATTSLMSGATYDRWFGHKPFTLWVRKSTPWMVDQSRTSETKSTSAQVCTWTVSTYQRVEVRIL